MGSEIMFCPGCGAGVKVIAGGAVALCEPCAAKPAPVVEAKPTTRASTVTVPSTRARTR